MSKVQVDKVVNLSDDGAPQLTYGAELPVGYGLTGAGGLNITGVVTAASAVFSGNVTIGGTLTYEDVTNIDALGIVTARAGVNVSGGELLVGSNIKLGNAGVVTATSFVGSGANLTGVASTDYIITGTAATFNNKVNINSTLTASEGINVTAGVGTFAGNVSIADKIVHTGDTNTAIRFPAADTITAETSGSERLRIDSSGNVGINTTNPNHELTVFGDEVNFRLTHSGSTNKYNALYTNVNGTGVEFNSYQDVTGTKRPFSFKQYDTERLNIDSSGNVGLGNVTAAPTSSAYNAGTLHIHQATGGASGGSQIKMTTTQSGTAAGDGAYLAYYGNNQLYIYNKEAADISFGTNAAERFRINLSGTVTTGISTATAFVPSAGQLSHRNLIHNGAFNIAQKGTSNTSSGFKCVDRWRMSASGASATLTQSQTAITSGDPFDAGFRNVFKIVNAGQNANTSGYCYMMHAVEAQDLAGSGWDYTSTSSYITLSFWIKASVAQTYLLTLHAHDSSTLQEYNHLITCTADTWKKVILVIPGKSTIAVDNDNGKGLEFILAAYLGSTYTSGSTVDQWVNHSGYTSRPDMGATWWTTSSSTIEITGVQLEVGSACTPFEHRTFSDELRTCQRYFYPINAPLGFIDATEDIGIGYATANTEVQMRVNCPVQMRATPTLEQTTSTNYWIIGGGNYGGDKYISNQWNVNNLSPSGGNLYVAPDSGLSSYIGQIGSIQSKSTSARMGLTAEI